jgi:hypothetical protein
MRQAILLLALGGLLSACATAPEGITGSIQQPPTNYRDQIRSYVKTNFKDPYSIRDAKIANSPMRDDTPLPLPSGLWASGFYVVCFSANAKNAFGAYAGITAHGAIFIDGVLNSVISNPRFDHFCSQASYAPFPELEA